MHLGSLEGTQEARVALGCRREQLLRFFRALQASPAHPELDIHTISMKQFFITKSYIDGTLKRFAWGNEWANARTKRPSESICKGRKSLMFAGKIKRHKNRKENENPQYRDLITWPGVHY